MSEQPNGSADAPQGPPPYPGQQPPPGQLPPPGQPPYGYPYSPQPYGYATAPEDPNARTAMITGIATLVVGFALCGLGFLGSPVALVMGLRSMRRIDQSNGALSGRGDAQAGFILGLVGTVMLALAVLALVAVIVFVVLVFSYGEISDTGFSETSRNVSVVL